MPRRAKGPGLYLRERSGANPVWCIRDGHRLVSTGCGAGDRPGAERELGRYLAAKHEPARGERRLCDIPIADVVSIYVTNCVPRQANQKAALDRAERTALTN